MDCKKPTKKALRKELSEKLFKYTELRVKINNASQYQEAIKREIRKIFSQLGETSFQNNYVRGWLTDDNKLEVK